MLANFNHLSRNDAAQLPLGNVAACSRRRAKTSNPCNDRNQQYSIIGLTNAAGTLVERYTYTAYGTLGIYAANGTVRTSSSYNNRYTYTGREYDPDLKLYHFRARWYDPSTGGFISRDPLGYIDGMSLYRGYFVHRKVDPRGLDVILGLPPEPPLIWLDVPDIVVMDLQKKCHENINLVSDPKKSNHPNFNDYWPRAWGKKHDTCQKLINKIAEGDVPSRIKRQLNYLKANGCNIPIKCECCENMHWGGGYVYWTDGREAPYVTICFNNLDITDGENFGSLEDILVHELVHANQHCYNTHWGPGCANKFKIEIEAYYCMGWCGRSGTTQERAMDCITKAIGSVCKDSAAHCPNSDLITQDLLRELIHYFAQNELAFCHFPK